MKSISLLLLAVSLFVLIPACKKNKDTDPRDNVVGKYYMPGTCKYVFDAFGRYSETYGLDTASFQITKPVSKDSMGFVYLQGVTYATPSAPGYTISFIPSGGVPIPAAFTDTLLTIPLQNPWSGGDLTVQGTFSFGKGKATLQYQSWYRGYTKYATVTTQP